MEIFDDLDVEFDRLDGILEALSAADWAHPSGAPGWSVADVVLHLAQTNEFVTASVDGHDRSTRLDLTGGTVDEIMHALVDSERSSYGEIFERWRHSRTAAVSALRSADPVQLLAWVAAPLKAASLATTRLAEHWAHGLDITGPLGIGYDDTDRLRHVAWLAHRTIPYAFAISLPGTPVPSVHLELVAPSGAVWRFGEAGADVVITGTAGEWCRLGAQRLTPAESGLVATGGRSADVLRLVRNYAV